MPKEGSWGNLRHSKTMASHQNGRGVRGDGKPVVFSRGLLPLFIPNLQLIMPGPINLNEH